jgi:uncharacterized membrane-anchored protein YjiN (DUF445 family)
MAVTTTPANPVALPRSRSEEQQRRALVTTRRRAGALLGFVTAVFAATTVIGADGWLGYVQATAEASMVGGIADWFAVTALFRHPLGVPIPHTAIIPERKDQFGDTLGSFISESFLTPDTIVERVRSALVAERMVAWLAEPENASRVAGHVLDGAVAVADLVKDDDVQRAIEDAVRTRLETVPLAPAAGRVLGVLTADGRHDEVVDAALRGLGRYLDEHQGELHARFEQSAPWWLPGAVEDRIFVRLLDGARRVLDEMISDPDHELRRTLDERIVALVHDLEHSPELHARGEQLKRDLLAQPQLRAFVATAWQDVKVQLRQQAADPESPLRRRIAEAIATTGARLAEDPALTETVQEGIESGVRYVVEHFHGEIATLVSGTIARWDGEETSRRLELLLGPDLQFIRINGTVVGGAAGLALHVIARGLGS